MERKLLFTICPEQEGQTVGDYLRGVLHLTPAQIRSLKFRENGISRNGSRVRVTAQLKRGDTLELCLEAGDRDSGQLEESGREPEILYEDEDVVCVWKPSGQVTHPAGKYSRESLANDLHGHYQKLEMPVKISGIGRLDKDTSGIVVFAKNRIAAARLSQQREQGIFQKEYLALCEGTFPEEAFSQVQTISWPIRQVMGKRYRMETSPDGKRAITHYLAVDWRDSWLTGAPDGRWAAAWAQEMLEVCQPQTGMSSQKLDAMRKPVTLIRLRLETGRTHQIRVHMAKLGRPLAGDPMYGNGQPGKSAACLCAWKVWFRRPFTGESIMVSADGISKGQMG